MLILHQTLWQVPWFSKMQKSKNRQCTPIRPKITEKVTYVHVHASIAQLVERPLSEREVVGSNPVAAPYQRCKNGTCSSLADARI